MVIFADKLYSRFMWPLFLGTETPAPLMLPDSVQKANFAETVHKIANLDFETVLQNLLSESVWILLKILLALAIYFVGRWILRRIVRLLDLALEHRRVDISLRSFMRNTVRVIFTLLLVLIVVSTLGVNVTSLIAVFSAATLAIAAAKQALERSGLSPQDIACCVCATLSAPDATPSVACQVQRALSLPENRPALDVNAACSGFIYGTAVARGLMATLGGRYALVVGCEALSRLMDQTDRSTCVLFGDGAGAAIFELCDAPFAITLGARGDEAIHAGGPCRTGSAPISMDGRAVFRFAVDALPRCLHAVLDETQLALDDVDWVVCHQANSRIIDHCVKALHADAAKFYKNMDRHGNTSAASIPVALNEMAEAGLLKVGQKVSCIGFGGGLTWGGMLVTYSPLSHG